MLRMNMRDHKLSPPGDLAAETQVQASWTNGAVGKAFLPPGWQGWDGPQDFPPSPRFKQKIVATALSCSMMMLELVLTQYMI